MEIRGDAKQLLYSVLPHEVTHTVLAHHFGRPVPRWADEGGSVLSENDEERFQHDVKCREFLNAGRAFVLRTLFRMTEYPRDMSVLYAQGYSVTAYLVEKGGGGHEGRGRAPRVPRQRDAREHTRKLERIGVPPRVRVRLRGRNGEVVAGLAPHAAFADRGAGHAEHPGEFAERGRTTDLPQQRGRRQPHRAPDLRGAGHAGSGTAGASRSRCGAGLRARATGEWWTILEPQRRDRPTGGQRAAAAGPPSPGNPENVATVNPKPTRKRVGFFHSSLREKPVTEMPIRLLQPHVRRSRLRV